MENQILVKKFRQQLENLKSIKCLNYEDYKENILPKINELCVEFDRENKDNFLFFYSIFEDEFGAIVGIRFPYEEVSCLLYGTISEKVAGRIMANVTPAKVAISKGYQPSIPTFFGLNNSKILNQQVLSDIYISKADKKNIESYIEDTFKYASKNIEEALELGIQVNTPFETKTINDFSNVKSALKVIETEMKRIVDYKNTHSGMKTEHQEELDSSISYTEKLIIKNKLDNELKKDNNSKSKNIKI